jgi:sec-independent protein translocase protein TatC
MALDQGEIEEEKSMSFFDHVDVLRKHLMRSIVVLVALVVVSFVYIETLFSKVILGPINSDFLTYRVLCNISQKLYENNKLCIESINIQLVNLQVQGQFMAAFKISLIAGIIMGFPYFLWEFWRFVKPALTKREKQMATGLVTFCSALFFSGVLFGYFILSPISINFFVGFSISDQIANQPTFQNIVGLVSVLSVGTGLLFELPILMYFLARIGLLSSSFLKKYRKFAMLVIIILSAIVTPPDMISQLILAFPIFLLYELGLSLTKGVERKRMKEMAEFDK